MTGVDGKHRLDEATFWRRLGRTLKARSGDSKPFVYRDPFGMWVAVTVEGEHRFLHRRWALKHAATRSFRRRGGILPGHDPLWPKAYPPVGWAA